MNPFTGAKLYVDLDSQAAAYCRNPANPVAPRIQYIASQPQAFWLGTWVANVQQYVANVLGDAAGQLITFVVYYLPSVGSNPATYSYIIDAIAAGINGASATFILEPDALAQADNTGNDPLNECLTYAINTLSNYGAVYLDMGHSNWQPAATMVTRYQAVGSTFNRGFSLNVSNFQLDADLDAYAVELYNATGKPSVTDTSRNGNGPDPNNVVCNPTLRALGAEPNSISSTEIDANLWIKRPGESDGACNNGIAPGVFLPAYAEAL